MKIYVTKHALTQGILELEAEPAYPDMVIVKKKGCFPAYYTGKEWHRSKKAAVIQANEMRDWKIMSLNEQLAEIEAITFE